MACSLLFLAFLLFLVVSAPASASNSDVNYSPPEKPNLRPWSLILVNIWCLILVFAAGISPYFLRLNKEFWVLGTKLAVTVFLGTGRAAMMHLLKDANQTFEELGGKKCPFAFMLTSCGYLLVMLAGCVISYIYGKQTNGGSDTPTVDLELQGNAEGGNLNGQSELQQQVMDETEENHYFLARGDSLLLIFALCFHSVFEGIAIGVAGDDDWKALWTILICFHKIFAAVSMGIALIPDRPLSSSIAYALAFAISSPAGVSIGIVIHATTQAFVADRIIYSISIHLAYGAFIFISMNYLLSKGYGPQPPVVVEKPYHKFVALLIGIGINALANI